MSKVLGYIITAIGLIGIAMYSFPSLQKAFGLALAPTITLISSLLIIALGAFLITKSGSSSSRREREIPIYHKNKLVGYRRH